MAKKPRYDVSGDVYRSLDKKMLEIKRLLNLPDGSAIDPLVLGNHLQLLAEGRARFSAIVPYSASWNINKFLDGSFQTFQIWRGSPEGAGLEGDEEVDLRAEQLSEVDWRKVVFEKCQTEEDRSIRDTCVYYQRLKGMDRIRLGARAAHSLWEEHRQNRDWSVLQWLYRERKIETFACRGTLLRNNKASTPGPYYFNFEHRNGQWSYHESWFSGWEEVPSACLMA